MEVALVFVDVLQGFETFVHRTEIWQRRQAIVDKVSTHKHHSKKNRGCCWQDLTSSDVVGRRGGLPRLDPRGMFRLNRATRWPNESTASPHTAAALSANAPRRSTISLHLISISVTHTHTQTHTRLASSQLVQLPIFRNK